MATNTKCTLIDYAIYRGDTFIFVGTCKECAEFMGVKESSVRGLTTHKYLKQIKIYNQSLIAIKLEREVNE
jgi:hypothetical protein